MMTYDQLREQLALITYKPGWEMTLWDYSPEGLFWFLVVSLENSYEPGKEVQLRIGSWLPWMETPRDFEHWLKWRLWVIETHELMEWLKREGKPINDPHRIVGPTVEEAHREWEKTNRYRQKR